MADRPILFSGPMVNAILDGRKTQTRRVLKPQPRHGAHVFCDGGYWYAHTKTGPGSDCIEVDAVDPKYAAGDRLWVRETWGRHDQSGEIWHYAMGDGHYADHVSYDVKWKPSIHMPRTMSRLTLVVTDVRVQRLHEITAQDAVAEGIHPSGIGTVHPPQTAVDEFHELWDHLNAKRGFGWEQNPWVVALTFKGHQQNIDQMPEAT